MSSSVARVSPKGQITIPRHLREALGISAGDRVELQVLRDGTVLLRPMTVTLDDLFGSIAYDGPPRSIDEINAGIAELPPNPGWPVRYLIAQAGRDCSRNHTVLGIAVVGARSSSERACRRSRTVRTKV
ncbi:AbrB/MazE/SpoVT family DNA-binding domain-containing protein, partial [Methylobrevis pamukkalensis]|uniref:AbrB/MazE/SpoVT family DNA-binding domain-containing protein n=1 Tax=Methylobrevis pamukkalensis TaxID=1439726 RepID=UPI001471D0F4